MGIGFYCKRDAASPVLTACKELTMRQYALRMPHSLMQAARDCAERDNTSMNQFFVVAIADKIAALTTDQFFKDKAALSAEQFYLQILAKDRNVSPIAGDEL